MDTNKSYLSLFYKLCILFAFVIFFLFCCDCHCFVNIYFYILSFCCFAV